MFRSLMSSAGRMLTARVQEVRAVRRSHKPGCCTITDESDPELDCKYEAYFNRPDIDGWEVRKGMNDLHGMDLVPEPKVIAAALRACRRVNDYALAVRYLESVKFKCGHRQDTIYPYIIQEIKPTLIELGIDTPEKLGYDKPELVLKSVYDDF